MRPTMQAQIDFTFKRSRSAGTSMHLHQHRCHELVYYETGTGTTRLNGVEYRYKPHTYALIPPAVPHDEYREEPSEVICIGFSLTGRELPPLHQGLYRDAADAPIFRAAASLLAELKEKRAFYDQLLQLRVSDIMIEHLRAVHAGEPERPEDSLLYARTFMDENFNQKLSIRELAALSGYSYDHFRHLFKTKFGRSPIQYLIDKRLERARSLLLYTHLSLTDITAQCGFSNIGQFCTMFKREIGETPLSFRQNRYSNTLYRSSR